MDCLWVSVSAPSDVKTVYTSVDSAKVTLSVSLNVHMSFDVVYGQNSARRRRL
jgi:hypothetical protein